MIYKIEQSEMVAPFFADWKETIIWSCLGNVMGSLYANAVQNPGAAMALLGDFCFLAGEPDEEIVRYKPEGCRQDFIIMIPRNAEWAEMIEKCRKEKAVKVTRYAMKKEPEIFDRAYLQRLVETLPHEYSVKMIDRNLFCQCKEIPWCVDLVSQYTDYEAYQKHGLGAVILKNREIISGASSYSAYPGGIEIEIDTKAEYRRKGLAGVCGARLILECLKRGLYPSWDAQNQISVTLAEKLGYHLDYEYTAYEIRGY